MLAMLLVPTVESWAVDRIVLKDGNVVEGEVIRTTERHITIKGRFGMITFPLKQIRRVRQDSKYWIPPEAPEPVDEDEDEDGWGDSLLKQQLLRSILEIEANPLGQWTSYPKEPAHEKAEHPYRLLKDGKHSYSAKLPRSPGEYERVWAHRREKSPAVSGGLSYGSKITAGSSKSLYYWVPLYWHESSSRWLPTHPRLSSFRWEENQVAKMLTRIASAKGRHTASQIEATVEKIETSPENRAELKHKLKQLTVRVAGEWGGDGPLYRVYLRNLTIAHASDKEKIELVRARRSELRQLISLMP